MNHLLDAQVRTMLKLAQDFPPPYSPDVPPPERPGPHYVARLIGDAALIAGGTTLGMAGADMGLKRLAATERWKNISPTGKKAIVGTGAAAAGALTSLVTGLMRQDRNRRIAEGIALDEARRQPVRTPRIVQTIEDAE
jgi:hypothetical protein